MAAKIPSDFYDLLKTVYQKNIDDYEIEIVPNEKGQGFIGEVVFVNLTHKETSEKKQVIVKQEQMTDGKPFEYFKNFFEKEIYFYGEVWPYLRKYYKNVSEKELTLVPKYLGTSNEERKRIILENIRPQGYELYDKRKPFDDDHLRIIFKTYGLYHGISMALRTQDYDEYNRLVGNYSNIHLYLYVDSTYGRNFVQRIKEIQTFFDPVEDAAVLEKLRFYEESGLQMLYKCVTENLPHEVILHGDCWSNNFMFKYDVSNLPNSFC